MDANRRGNARAKHLSTNATLAMSHRAFNPGSGTKPTQELKKAAPHNWPHHACFFWSARSCANAVSPSSKRLALKGLQVACAHLKRQSKAGGIPCSPMSRHTRIHHPPRGLQVACAHLKRQSHPGGIPCWPMSRHTRIHHPPRGIHVACAHVKRQSKDPHAQP